LGFLAMLGSRFLDANANGSDSARARKQSTAREASGFSHSKD
jgi:hypothetical protein